MRTSTSLPVLEALRELIQRLEGGAARRKTVLPFGIKAIDQHLPEGGLALGALHEVAGGGNGAVDGAAAALFAAGLAAGTRGRGRQGRDRWRGRCALRRRHCGAHKRPGAGLVLVRQMPGSAKGVMFITIE